MDVPMETHLYVISCLDPVVTARYLGYTTNFEKVLEMHSDDHDIPHNIKTFLYQFILGHGGWDNWDHTIIGTYGSRGEAKFAKEQLLLKHVFQLNTYNV
jgi:hypothetical protein